MWLRTKATVDSSVELASMSLISIAHRMALDRDPVVLADLDIHANDLTAADQFHQGRVEDESAAMRDSTFDDDIWPSLPDQLLQHDDVLWSLDDWDTHPGRLVRDLVLPA